MVLHGTLRVKTRHFMARPPEIVLLSPDHGVLSDHVIMVILLTSLLFNFHSSHPGIQTRWQRVRKRVPCAIYSYEVKRPP